MKESFADILKQIETRRASKLKAKLPGWDIAKGIVLPDDLALEQCSGSAAARYKSGLAKRFSGKEKPRIADLTGGLGVDSLAFAGLGGEVLYNERESNRAEAAEKNFKIFGANNISLNSKDIRPGQQDWQSMLEAFFPDLLYLDPARRDGVGKKVFRLEDCSPDVSALLPELTAICPRIMLKLSPMADISVLCSSLQGLQELHIVQLAGEVKELLCLIDAARSDEGEETLIVLSELSDPCKTWSFRRSEEAACSVGYGAPVQAGYLYEPEAALSKAGAFKLPCSLAGVHKAAASTHLYLSDSALPREGISSFLKPFITVELFPLDKASLKLAGRKYPRAEVSARNIPMTSDELRKRLGVKSGPEYHIFGFSTPSGRILAVCRPCNGCQDGVSGSVPGDQMP